MRASSLSRSIFSGETAMSTRMQSPAAVTSSARSTRLDGVDDMQADASNPAAANSRTKGRRTFIGPRLPRGLGGPPACHRRAAIRRRAASVVQPAATSAPRMRLQAPPARVGAGRRRGQHERRPTPPVRSAAARCPEADPAATVPTASKNPGWTMRLEAGKSGMPSAWADRRSPPSQLRKPPSSSRSSTGLPGRPNQPTACWPSTARPQAPSVGRSAPILKRPACVADAPPGQRGQAARQPGPRRSGRAASTRGELATNTGSGSSASGVRWPPPARPTTCGVEPAVEGPRSPAASSSAVAPAEATSTVDPLVPSQRLAHVLELGHAEQPVLLGRRGRAPTPSLRRRR